MFKNLKFNNVKNGNVLCMNTQDQKYINERMWKWKSFSRVQLFVTP